VFEVIARVAGDLVDAMVSYVSGFFGRGMELVRLFHPDRGLFFDLLAAPDG
jgi:hypothetical protein